MSQGPVMSLLSAIFAGFFLSGCGERQNLGVSDPKDARQKLAHSSLDQPLGWSEMESGLGARTLGDEPSHPIFPLSTVGRYIIDRHGQRFKLKAVNWYGSHLERQVPGGLEHQSMDHIIALIKEWEFNAVRLPFSNQMLRDNAPVSDGSLAANPDLRGLTPLQVFDRTVLRLAEAGIAVILNNHTTFSEWCCSYDDNGLWLYHGSRAFEQTYDTWRADWQFLIERYRGIKAVVAADLRNEVRTMKFRDSLFPTQPEWGSGSVNDWHWAAESLGREINRWHPDLLVVVEGINWTGLVPRLGSGGRPHLKPVRDLPVHLLRSDKLVYAAHNYAYVGPRHNGDANTSAGQTTYGDLGPAIFRETIQDEWGYLLEDGQHYTAPVWVSEFGAGRQGAPPTEQDWFVRMIDEMIEKDLDFAYWPLNPDAYGLVTEDWSQITRDDWRYDHMRRLLSHRGSSGPFSPQLWHALNLKRRDDDRSGLEQDWLVGARKGACAPGYRLIGLSRDQRGLCSNTQASYHGSDVAPFTVEAVDETAARHHGTEDWATGRTKYECPPGHYAAGFTKHHWGTSGLICRPSQKALSQICQTRWFDQGDQRASVTGGDWALGAFKGQCGENEYMAGLAQIDGTASAILCCQIRESGRL